MSTDVRDDTSAASSEDVSRLRRQRRRGWIILAIGLWNVWVWATRLQNVLTDDNPNTTAFDVVHSTLFTVSSVLATVLVVVGARMLLEVRREGSSGRGPGS